ncbi:MAG: histidine utilization repressor [Gemmatimonadales bacterium]|nr:histidine utilization repressor [Gemmatimonadales bacterium]
MTMATTSYGNNGGTATLATSLHQRIQEELEHKIIAGNWLPGHRIPSERELTAYYGCSRMTVNKAMTRLANAGLIERKRKTGSFVKRPHSQAAVLEIHDLKAEVSALGMSYDYRIIDRAARPANPSDRQHLELDSDSPVLEVNGLHLAADQPFCHERRVINLAAVPQAAEESFADTSPGSWLVNHVPWTEAEHRIRAVPASAEMAHQLQIPRGTACLVVERRTWRTDHTVTHVTLTYPGSVHQLVARFAPSA